MKLVIINDAVYAYASDDPQAVGGAERQQWLLARALAGAGWSVTVGVRDFLKPGNRAAIEGVQFVGLPQYQSFLSPYQRQFSLYRFLRSERPDWLYWRCADYLLGPSVEIAKCLSVRTIFSAAVDGDVKPRTALYRRRYCWPLYLWGLLRVDKIFVQHVRQLAELSSSLQMKASILPNIVDLPMTAKSHLEREKYIAWVAMFREVKRPDLLIEAARKLPQIRFVVCGAPTTFRARPGYGEQIVKELSTVPNIDYRGQVSPTEAREIISHAAVFLSTSVEEGFPNTFLEAWAAGTPVISMQCDPGSVIERFGLGRVPGDFERTLEAINNLTESSQERESIAIQTRRYVANNHGESAVVSAFEEGVRNITSCTHSLPSRHQDHKVHSPGPLNP